MDIIRNNFEHVMIIILSKMITTIMDQGPLLGTDAWRLASGYAMMSLISYRRLIHPWLIKTMAGHHITPIAVSIAKFAVFMGITRWATGGSWNRDLLIKMIYVCLGIIAYHISISLIEPKIIPSFLVGQHELFENVILIGVTINLNLGDLNIVKAWRDMLISIGLNLLYLKLMQLYPPSTTSVTKVPAQIPETKPPLPAVVIK